MTRSLLRQLCLENGLYTSPAVNDKLYLHYKGFREIENLEEYVNLKVLWLEGNGLVRISNLDNQKVLKCLYLHENAIENIEGLDALLELDTLNLSRNFIHNVQNIGHLGKLTTLNLSYNRLTSFEDIEELGKLSSLQALDLQHNQLVDERILDIFASLPDLRVLQLLGNPVVKHIRHYRKMVVAKCKLLKYLDERPVFDEERRRVDAWYAAFVTGGLNAANAAEQDELTLIRKEKDEAEERNFRAMEELMLEGKRIRQQQREQERQARLANEAAGQIAQLSIEDESTDESDCDNNDSEDDESDDKGVTNAAVDQISGDLDLTVNYTQDAELTETKTADQPPVAYKSKFMSLLSEAMNSNESDLNSLD